MRSVLRKIIEFVDFSNVLYFSTFMIFTICFSTKYVNTFR